MAKRERISQFVRGLGDEDVQLEHTGIADHPFYRAYFRCWNDQRYYEAHDVLEHLWLHNETTDDNFFKGLIQAAGAFVHLQKNFEYPTHAKHGRRLRPAVRLFQLAEKNLVSFAPHHHGLDVGALIILLRSEREKIEASDFTLNPWSPATAPQIKLG
jgi:predicted metal-dependent hydrolase